MKPAPEAALIRSLRSKLGWTQQRLATELATDQGTVSRWERGVSRPRRSARHRLEILGLDGRRRFARFPVGVAMTVVDDRGRILLFEDPDSGSLEIPSGAVEDGETIIDAVRRELTEELGPWCTWHPVATVHTYTIRYDAETDLISVVYLVAFDGGNVSPSDDAEGSIVRWIRRCDLDPLRDRVTVPSEHRILDLALDLWATRHSNLRARTRMDTGHMVSEEDKRRMRRLAEDLKAIESDTQIEGQALRDLIHWINEWRVKAGISPLETRDDNDIPEQGLYDRAKALGMVRARRGDPQRDH
jgi:8-oxo-dGTP pyrophosphatase MutT (NUDIX family)